MWISIINLLLNPFGLLFFLFCVSGNNKLFYSPAGTNIVKLKIKPFVIFHSVFAALVLGLTFGFGYLFVDGFEIWEAYQPKYYWLSIIGWGVTLITLKTYFSGMEGNIMGFIFFPMLAVTSIGLLVANVASLFSVSVAIETPQVSQDYFWLGFAAQCFLPIHIMMLSASSKDPANREWYLPIFSSLIFQLMLFSVNWLVITFFGGNISFKMYFGAGQNYLFYLPIVGGFLYFVMYKISGANNDRS